MVRHPFITCGIILSLFRPSAADELQLDSGARLHGEFLTPAADEGRPRFKTQYGVAVTVEAKQVVNREDHSRQQTVYTAFAPGIADTAAEHWRVAEWCRANNLQEQRAHHLQRILVLEPNHALARRALGHTQIAGQWTTRQDAMRAKGYRHFHGRWRLAQEIELIRVRQDRRETEQAWIERLSRWRNEMIRFPGGGGARSIAAVRDPAAIMPIHGLLKEEPQRRVKLHYVEALGGIDDERSTQALVQTLLYETDPEVALACVDQLANRESARLVRTLTKALTNPRPQAVNRAAYMLGELQATEAIPALIEGLVTIQVLPHSPRNTHQFARATIPTGTGDPTTHFQAGSGMLGPPRFAYLNQPVLDTLVKLSGGVSFGFDQPAWRHWHLVHSDESH